MAVTIKDVSAKCGLSISTVSKAFNNYADISLETRELVQRTAREIGYYPNAIARTLKTNRSYNLGVLFQEKRGTGLTHSFFASVLDAFKSAGEKRGYDITFINHHIGWTGMTYLEHCRYRNVDGVCVVCADFYAPEVIDLAGQYKYTQEIATSADGKLKAVTWQATPGLFAYRRSIAKDVLGTDDPDAVQEALADWDKFNAVAEQAAAKGYYMLSGYDDAYRTFSNNVSAPWVADDGETVVVDANLMKWVDQTKLYTDKGYNHKSSLWDATWAADQGPTGKVFGFFYSTWGINFTLLGNSLETSVANGGKEEVGNGAYGDYAVCQGPQAYYWGGTWICAAAGTDNVATIKDVMQKLTCDAAIAKKITEDTQDYTNNVAAMNELAQNYSSAFLGGQNHIALFAEAAPKIDMSNISAYDQGLNESFQGAFKNYFDGNATIDEAKAQFESIISEKYPELVNFQWPDAE